MKIKPSSLPVGNTPLVRMQHVFSSQALQFYAKLEYMNPGGSIKDRTATRIIKRAIENRHITRETTIVESTSGNMGIGLARICRLMGLRLVLVVDPYINPQAEKILRAFGAELVCVEEDDGKGGFLNTRLQKVKDLLDTLPDSFHPDQYTNPDNPGAHFETVKEILQSLQRVPDYIFVPTSTCGTLMGIYGGLENLGHQTRLVAVDAEGSVIFKDTSAKRRIPGMGSSRPSSFVKTEKIYRVLHIAEKDIVAACRRVVETEAMIIGGSSGAVIAAVTQLSPEIPPGSDVVGIFADSGERYLDTIYNETWVNAGQ
ncbi:2,3-diaminopropionate biosynthesis protein SbnA [Sinomicrobium soli]|uniref:2,3-diaminopropionate biosynthesis protein SbnA n=1 Tax=Sinomicrobium sp. N-1-3-6 TaxID=2219864 RepID=UPI001374C732|nr:2,3-diaminopropionate biosynthesis protein SbnA [Sinomicrobium sp. N-1-3-6]